MKKIIGIIFADTMEYLPFERYTQNEDKTYATRYSNESFSFSLKRDDREIEVIAVKAGIGKSNAAMAASLLIGCDKADMIFNAGLSGAVSMCRRGDFLVGERFVECDFDLTAIGYKPGEKSDGQNYIYFGDSTLISLAKKSNAVKGGSFGTGDLFLTDKAKKDFYKETFSINAFDMETGAIAAVCDKCSVPFLSVRKISDDADDSAVSDYTQMNDAAEECLSELLIHILDRVIKEDSLW